MKIVSINLEGTDKLVSEKLKTNKHSPVVVFNLERPLSQDATEKLMSRPIQPGLTIKVNESCLTVTVTTTGDPINSKTVYDINKILKGIEKEEQDFLPERIKVLQAIAEETKLGFDKSLDTL